MDAAVYLNYIFHAIMETMFQKVPIPSLKLNNCAQEQQYMYNRDIEEFC